MKVSNEPISISDILKDKIFTIPLYQREYSWTLDQVSDLYYDILVSEGESHFLGSLLLYKSQEYSNRTEIVDGQQRVTTLFILLLAIFEELQGSGKTKAITRIQELLFIIDPNDLSDEFHSSEPRLETGKRDRKLFKAIIRGEDFLIHKDGRRKSHNNLTNTLEFFQARLKEIRVQNGIEGIVNYTESAIKTQFVVMTAEHQSDKLLLFKTVNARGLDLTQGDLIKNELCHSVDQSELDEIVDEWDEMRGLIESNKGKLDTFLFHYINSVDYIQLERKELDKKKGVIKWDKNNYPPVPEKYMFDMYSRIIKREGHVRFVNNILKASNDYVKFINPPNDDIHMLGFRAMGVNKCFPLFLNTILKLSQSNFKKVVIEIEKLTFRHSILRNDPKELERFYYDLCHEIKSDDNVNEGLMKIAKHQNFRDEDKFKNEFVLSSPKMSISKMILDRICRKVSESIDWSNKDVHIEHVMPQTPDGQWLILAKDKEVYKDYLNRLGNLTILQDKKNIKARNKDFSVKKDFYKESRLMITKDLCDYDNWNFETIVERQEALYDIARDIWS